MKVTRKDLCRDFLGTDTKFVADILLNKWWDISEVSNRTRNLTSFHTRSRMFETLDIALHFAVPSRQFKTKGCRLSVHTVGTPHHDGKLVLLSLISNDVGEIFKVTTDDVVGLLVEVTVGRIYHIGRSRTIVDPLALFTKRLRNRTREGNHIMARLLLNL